MEIKITGSIEEVKQQIRELAEAFGLLTTREVVIEPIQEPVQACVQPIQEPEKSQPVQEPEQPVQAPIVEQKPNAPKLWAVDDVITEPATSTKQYTKDDIYNKVKQVMNIGGEGANRAKVIEIFSEFTTDNRFASIPVDKYNELVEMLEAELNKRGDVF